MSIFKGGLSMKPRIIVSLLLAILVLTGCSKAILRSDSDPNTNLGLLKTFYVRKFSEDNRGLEKIIAKTLNGYGFQATDGTGAIPPTPVDALVTYKDRWMWDITMYMLEINIELRNPDTNFMFASGNSYRTSLVRKSPEEMIDEVLRSIFAGKLELPKPKSEAAGDNQP
jgi:hypothetical protein